MKSAEREVLNLLREGPLWDTLDSEFKVIELEIDKKGIQNLTGVAAMIVYGAVEEIKSNLEVAKHGDHDQSSHGSWSENPHNADNPRHMDSMDMGLGRPKKQRKLSMAERMLIARIASPATNYARRAQRGGYSPQPDFGRTYQNAGKITGYVPNPSENPS